MLIFNFLYFVGWNEVSEGLDTLIPRGNTSNYHRIGTDILKDGRKVPVIIIGKFGGNFAPMEIVDVNSGIPSALSNDGKGTGNGNASRKKKKKKAWTRS